ncbi:MAG: tetratricopeptide repeat protein [Desulfobacteraceae bacterium]|nr:tetratricopeptide repeat protein [Desulfobacteraceae bacterium]
MIFDEKNKLFCFCLSVLQATCLIAVIIIIQAVSNQPFAGQLQGRDEINHHIKNGEFAQALELMKPYIDYPEIFPSLYSDYLAVLVWSGNYTEAVRRFESLPAKIPRRSYLLRNMAKAYFDLESYEKATDLYQKTISIDPADHIALTGLTNCFIHLDAFDKAQTALQQFQAQHRLPLELKLLKGKLFFLQEKHLKSLKFYDAMITNAPDKAVKIASYRDDMISGSSFKQKQKCLNSLKTKLSAGDAFIKEQYILCLVLIKNYSSAVTFYESSGLDSDKVCDQNLYWIGWAYYKTGCVTQAMALFDSLLKKDDTCIQPALGRVYCLAAMEKYPQANAQIDYISKIDSGHPELPFARAHVLEKQGLFWQAIQQYGLILKKNPANDIAKKLQLQAYSDMGASYLANEMASKQLPGNQNMANSLQRDQAINLLKWNENVKAIDALQQLASTTKNPRYYYDYIMALSQDGRHSQVIAQFEKMDANAQGDAPAWLKNIIAGSYQAVGQPEKALEVYDEVLKEQPGYVEARMGKFYALQDLRRWKQADALLEDLIAETSKSIKKDTSGKLNPELFDLLVVKGWYLAHQNRLRDSYRYFQSLHAKSPANLEVRNALAHVKMWRGWYRSAKEAFDIIETRDNDYQPAQPGKIMALNDLVYKKRSRDEVKLYLIERPGDIHLKQVLEDLKIEQMNESVTNVYWQREDDKTYELSIRQELSTPLSLKTRLFTYLLHRRIWHDKQNLPDDDTSAYFKRIGIGIDHIFNADWKLRQTVSANYNDGKDWGSTTEVVYTPSDHWTFAAFGDSYSTDVSKLARIEGIQAKKMQLEAVWRQSEWRQAGASAAHSRFSDDNQRNELTLNYQQNLWAKHDWRMRLFLDLYTVRNSKGDQTLYFNPEKALSLSATHMTEQTVWRTHGRAFVHRLYLTVGNYKQFGYAGHLTGALRYEQTHEFSKRHLLQAGVTGGRDIYDGQEVKDITCDLFFVWRF